MYAIRSYYDGEKGLAVFLERAGRVAVRHGHAPLELGHDNDFYRFGGHRDQAFGRDEALDLLEIGAGLIDDGRVVRTVVRQSRKDSYNFV